MKSFFFDCGTRDLTASIGVAALRIMIGLMMLVGHGIPKIQMFSAIQDKFYVPDFFPFKYMSAPVSLSACLAAEVGAATLIILGLATRPAAFILGFNMVVAAFAVHASAPWFMGAGIQSAKEPAILYLIPLIALILTGAGNVSLDAFIHTERKHRLRMSI